MPWPQCGYKAESKYIFTVFMSICWKRYLFNKAVTTMKEAIFDFKIAKMFL